MSLRKLSNVTKYALSKTESVALCMSPVVFIANAIVSINPSGYFSKLIISFAIQLLYLSLYEDSVFVSI